MKKNLSTKYNLTDDLSLLSVDEWIMDPDFWMLEPKILLDLELFLVQGQIFMDVDILYDTRVIPVPQNINNTNVWINLLWISNNHTSFNIYFKSSCFKYI